MESDSTDVIAQFHKLEKECVGYDNYVDADEEHYLKTLEGLRKLVGEIQRQSLFSPNEELQEVPTEHLKLFMAPFYQAEVLFRIMDNRAERVKLAHVFYLEYLRLLNHYGVLEKEHAGDWKHWMNRHKVQVVKARTDCTPEEIKEAEEIVKELQAAKRDAYAERENKIAAFKMKKLISASLD